MKSDYDVICNHVESFKEQCSFDEFLKLFILIMSRVFAIVIHGKKTKGMIPLVDMPNHSYSSNNLKWHYSEEQNGFIFDAQDEIQKG